jgi:hypothetical protein
VASIKELQMTRLVRAKVVLTSIVLLLAFAAVAMLSAPVAGAAPAHISKKAKKAKKKAKAKKKQSAKKGSSKKVANATVTGGSETLTFSVTAVQTLEKDKVSTTIVSPATGTLASGIVFALSGGTLNPGTGLGSVTAGGGVTFATSFSVPGLFNSESSLTASEPSVALNTAPTLSFTSQNASPPTFPFATISLKGVKPTSGSGTLTLANAALSLTATGAQFMNQFASNAFTSGEAIGTLTIQATVSG